MSRLWLQLFLYLRVFTTSFAHDCQKSFIFENLEFLSHELGTNDPFTMMKINMCTYFGPGS